MSLSDKLSIDSGRSPATKSGVGKITIVTMFAVSALVGCGRVESQTMAPPTPSPEPHVELVLLQRWIVRTNSVTRYVRQEHGPGWAAAVTHNRFSPAIYARAIQKIDASKCPKEFQLVWMDYCHAWRNVEDDSELILLLAEGATAVSSGGSSIALTATATHGVAAAQKRNEKRHAVDEAWYQLQKAAVIFNCASPTNYVDL